MILKKGVGVISDTFHVENGLYRIDVIVLVQARGNNNLD